MAKVMRMLLEMGVVFADIWMHKALGFAPTSHLRFRGRIEAAAVKTKNASLSTFWEVSTLELQHKVAVAAKVQCSQCSWLGRLQYDMKQAWQTTGLGSCRLAQWGTIRVQREFCVDLDVCRHHVSLFCEVRQRQVARMSRLRPG